MLDPFGPEIWIADGTVVNAFAGFHYPTRMAVIRLPDGGLLIWSPVQLTARLRDDLGALGPVRHILAPNSLHHLYLAEWLAAFPDSRAHGAPGLAAKRVDIAFASELGDQALSDWAGVMDQVVVRGNLITEEVVFLHRPSGTVLITDLIQQLPPTWFRGWRGVVARLDLIAGPGPEVPRKFRVTFVGRSAARRAVARILAWPAQKVVMAHGTPIRADGAAVLRRVFGWLMR
jgi:hypothetical protein